MKTSDAKNHLPWLDGWRGIAIALVLLDHFGNVLLIGRLGVEVFFVLSGLLITRILFEQRVDLGTFYRRRLARIFPVFYLYVLVMALVGLLLVHDINWMNLGATMTFSRAYVGDHVWRDPLPFANLWSLNVEEHAYVILSLLAFVASKYSERAARWLLTGALLAPLAGHAYVQIFPETGTGTPFHLRTEGAIFPLLASGAIFMWMRAYRVEVQGKTVLVVLASTIATAVVDTIGVPHGGTIIKYLLLPLLLALSVNVLERAPSFVLNCLSARWLRWLGTCSFSIYLWHYPFYVLVQRGAWPFGRPLALVCGVALGALSFYWFERPMRSLLRGSEGKVGGMASAPAA